MHCIQQCPAYSERTRQTIPMKHFYNCVYEPVYPRHPHHFLFYCSMLLFRVSFSRLTSQCCFDAVLITAYCFSTSLRRLRIQTCWSISLVDGRKHFAWYLLPVITDCPNMRQTMSYQPGDSWRRTQAGCMQRNSSRYPSVSIITVCDHRGTVARGYKWESGHTASD